MKPRSYSDGDLCKKGSGSRFDAFLLAYDGQTWIDEILGDIEHVEYYDVYDGKNCILCRNKESKKGWNIHGGQTVRVVSCCGAIFHSDCIETFVFRKQHNFCPVCLQQFID